MNYILIVELILSIGLIIVSLAMLPGTIGNKTIYVKKEDIKSELKLEDIKYSVGFLSGALVLLIIALVVTFRTPPQ